MLVTVIVSCLLYLLLLGRYFCGISETASTSDFADEWVFDTADTINSHALFELQQETFSECEPALQLDVEINGSW